MASTLDELSASHAVWMACVVSEADYSFAAAVGLFNSVINLILLVLVNRFARRVSGAGLW